MTAPPPVNVAVHDIELACLTSASIADTSRPLVVCLHGFPDSATTWRHLLPALDGAGFRAVAPYLRGYAPSAVPLDGCVQTGASALDAIGLHDALDGDERAVVIGHDWGASIAYGAASHAPDRWAKVVGLAIPPGAALAAALVRDLAQVKRSWYAFYFQHGLADVVVPANDLAFIDMLWADWSPGYAATDDVAAAKDALRDPANLTAALGYYRAALGDGYVNPELADVQAATQAVPPHPTLYLHGATDGCVGAEVAESARPMVAGHVAIEVLDGVGHFLHLEDPSHVNRLILEFIS